MAEAVFTSHPGIEAQSAGLDNDSDVVCSPELLEWADLVFVMEKTHKAKLTRRFQRHLGQTRVICLGIPDRYAFMQPELIALLRTRAGPHLPKLQPARHIQVVS